VASHHALAGAAPPITTTARSATSRICYCFFCSVAWRSFDRSPERMLLIA
jgi:hypothetical protein